MDDNSKRAAQTIVPRIRDPQYREIYSNISLTALSPFDITVTFQRSSEIVPNQVGVTDIVAVTMSPQHFKSFVKSVTETMAAYEEAFGKLAILDTDTAPSKTAPQIVQQIKEAREAFSAKSSSSEPPQREKQSHGARRRTKPVP